MVGNELGEPPIVEQKDLLSNFNFPLGEFPEGSFPWIRAGIQTPAFLT